MGWPHPISREKTSVIESVFKNEQKIENLKQFYENCIGVDFYEGKLPLSVKTEMINPSRNLC